MSEEIKMPKDSDEAAAMVLIGMSWLESNDKSKLTEVHQELSREVAARAVEPAIRSALRTFGNADLSEDEIKKLASEYSRKVLRGEI